MIEDQFTTSLRRWLEERSLTMIVVALVTGFISMMANAPTLFTILRGGDLTAQEVTVSRDRVARDITSVLSRLRSAQAGAKDLAAFSLARMQDEEQQGGTCNVRGGTRGERW